MRFGLEAEVESAIQAIQAILAPAVMLTTVALLLLTMNTRHSSLVNRIRLLDDEARQLRRNHSQVDQDKQRLGNIEEQQSLLLPRIRHIRNAILSLSLSAIFFVLTSFWIALGYFPVEAVDTQAMIHITFLAGMSLVLCGVLFLAIEIYQSYNIILVEVKGRT